MSTKAERKHKRVGIGGQVAVLHRGQFHFEVGVQISEGGMLIQADREFSPGESVEVCFFIEEDKYVSVLAEVIYRLDVKTGGGSCFGLKFINTSPQALALIRQYADRQKAVG